MIEYRQGVKGYYYKKYKNGKQIRISKDDFFQKGGEIIINNNKNTFSHNINKNKQNFCLYKNQQIIHPDYLNNTIEEDNIKVFYFRNDADNKVLSFILYSEEEKTHEKLFYKKNKTITRKKKFTFISIDVLCSNINYKGKGTELMNNFLDKYYDDNTVIALHPVTTELIEYYRTKLKYPLAAKVDSGGYIYLFFTPNKNLLKYLELGQIEYYNKNNNNNE